MSEILTEEKESNLPAGDAPVPENATPETELPPKKKRRCLKWVLWFLALVFLTILAVLAFCLGSIGKWVIDKKGAELLGVDQCSVQSLKIYPFDGYVRVENLLIGKPIAPGSAFSQDLLKLEYFEFDFEVLSALSQKKIIDRLVLKNLNLAYEKPSTGASNVAVLAERFAQASDSAERVESVPEEAPEADSEPAEPIYVAARYVDVENINVHAIFSGVPTPLPPVSFKFENGLGLDKDLTPVEFGMRLAGNFMSIFRVLHGTILGDALGMTSDAISGLVGATGTAVSDAAGLTATAVSDVASATGDAVGATVGVVGDMTGVVLGIFSKKSDKDEDEKENDAQADNKKK